MTSEDDTWYVLTLPDWYRLAFQLAPQYAPPRFPDPAGHTFCLVWGIAQPLGRANTGRDA